MGIRLFFIGLIVTALAGGGFYVMKLQKDNAILKANAIKMESAITEQKQLIENQKKDFESILTANKEMNDLIGKLKTDFAGNKLSAVIFADEFIAIKKREPFQSIMSSLRRTSLDAKSIEGLMTY